jgi:hypothetical protein
MWRVVPCVAFCCNDSSLIPRKKVWRLFVALGARTNARGRFSPALPRSLTFLFLSSSSVERLLCLRLNNDLVCNQHAILTICSGRHAFHASCAETWFWKTSKHVCPYCRKVMTFGCEGETGDSSCDYFCIRFDFFALEHSASDEYNGADAAHEDGQQEH